MKNTISSLIMLSAGMIAVIACILLRYTLEATLIAVVSVLFVFMIVGMIAQKLINNMTKEAEERFQQEEAKRKEEEALAEAEEMARIDAEAQENAFAEKKDKINIQATEAMLEKKENRAGDTEAELDANDSEPTKSMQE